MNNNQPSTEVILESLYSRFVEYLKDYKLSTTTEWRAFLLEDLKEIYKEALSYSDVKNIELNPYYRLIALRPLEEHLILIQRNHNVI